MIHMKDLKAIKLKIASPEEILKWSHGEVTKPETINYRTQRPEKDSLFSERIFGPTKDWECYCGKYRRIRYKGIVCDKCGVEVTRSIVRRERMGHIKLATPVAHIWFLKSAPSKISLFLNVPLPKAEKVIYYAAYIVTSINEENRKRVLAELDQEFKSRKKTSKDEGVKATDLKEGMEASKKLIEGLEMGMVLSEAEYHSLARRFGDVFEAGTGAEAIRKIFEQIDLKDLKKEIEKELETKKDVLAERRLLKKLKMVVSMIKHNMRPEWTIMTVLPVLPPDLRPMVALDGGRYATSDLNDLYRRVINRNNRLKKLLELKAPEVIVINEKRMLQEAVDALIDNSARFGTQQMSSQRRPLRSLADMLKGKQGRFRQNLLGKRVDYSGRSVIVIGPNLKLNQCGLPKKMALELFKPFVINKIIERGLAHNIRNSNRLIEQAPPEVWAILEEVIADRKVLLNRAPTLHRLGVQAFEPLLIEDLAIRIPPMVCSAFNADFDGDQMAVHLPLSESAQKESREIMLSSLNLLKPATGDPIVSPTQDIILGCYYLTKVRKDAKGTGKNFATIEEALMAYETGVVEINALVQIGPKNNGLETSVGRIIFNETLPDDFEFVNDVINKRNISKLVSSIINIYGPEKSADCLNAIKKIGFEYATISGITWSMSDLVIPKEKPELLKKAEDEVEAITKQFEEGLLTESERKARVINVWEGVKSKISKLVPLSLDEFNPIYSIIDSGARGSWLQPVQMMGMKGLVANPKNETIELPIKASYKEGLTALEFFINTHSARKGTTDTALKTASAGYLTRRLIDVSQDIVVREEDCGTKEGITVYKKDGSDLGQTFGYGNQLFSRTALEDIKVGNKTIVKAGEIIGREEAEIIEKSDLESVKLRSPISCKTLYGVCSKCYGFDLGHNHPVKIGAAVGIVAAQSIGEPGTQLTMRTFHTGGIAGADITHGLPRVEEVFEARPPKGRAFMAKDDGIVQEIEEKGLLKIVKIKSAAKGKTKKEKIEEYSIPRLATLYVKKGDEVKRGDQISEGNLDIKELFEFKGEKEVERYILSEVQKIYFGQGTSVNNKHLEIIVRQMFSRVKVKESGDTEFIRGEVLEKSQFLEVNREKKRAGKTPAKAVSMLLGITKVALSTESFLSAASFQETAKVLINAACEGKVDRLRGLKENVIIGRLIPVGSTMNSVETEDVLDEEELIEGKTE
ncbi:MAG: DNA-directed RNA polymerase subunit beta' [Candidatus Pacebacteria bacterium]|nr:DNA-directed RNA polymerase subunit beta' [Candidatus Paceibacterota bacterium]